MDNVIILFTCLIAGVFLRLSRRMPENAHASLNVFIIHISLPALILSQMRYVTLSQSLVYAALMPWVFFATSTLLFCIVGKILRLPASTTGALAVLAGLGNTSFIGLPMIEAFYGQIGMPVGIVIDQLGTYLALSTVGIVLICFYGEKTVSRKEIVLRITQFPPLIALVIALILMPMTYPEWLSSIFARLGGTLAPLALVSVGLQLKLGALRRNTAPLAMGIGFKLVLGPLLMLLLYAGVFGFRGPITQITLFESAMAPQIGASIIATQYGLNAELISLVVGIGTVLSFITLPIWWQVFDLLNVS